MARKRFTSLGLIAGIWLLLSGCGSTSSLMGTTGFFSIVMRGVSEIPTGATGTADPISQEWSLSGVKFIKDTGEIAVFNQAAGAEPVPYKISRKEQTIFNEDLSDQDEIAFIRIILTFSKTVKVVGKINPELTFSLSSADQPYDIIFIYSKKNNYTMHVKVKWKNTMTPTADSTDEAVSPSELSMVLDDI